MTRTVLRFPPRRGKNAAAQEHLQPLAEIESYWHVRAGGRPMPDRAEIGPHGMEAALPHALLIERIAPGIGRLRLAGGHLRDLMGMELRGMPISALVEPDARPLLADAIDTALDLPALVHVDVTSAPGLGRPALQGRLLLAPLSSRDGRLRMLLGGLAMTGAVGRPPRRLCVGAVSVSPIAGAVWDGASSVPTQAAEPVAVFAADKKAERPDAMRPALRLVKSGV